MTIPEQSVVQPCARQCLEDAAPQLRRRWNDRARLAMVLGAGSAALLSGCINVAAPEDPIVIELNINIRQEVIYRLAADAANTIEEYEDIF